MLLDLPSVTLMCADCVNVERAIKVLETCKAKCNFGAVKLFTSLPTDYPHVAIGHLGSLSDYSDWCLTRMHEFIDTPHFITVQHDGWILNPDVWDPAWLNYDYMGPLFLQEHQPNDWSVGSGGFSFRSKAMMEYVAKISPKWEKGAWPHEDGEICKHHRATLQAAGFKYPTALEAAKFAQGGNPNPNYFVQRPFGFHGMWANINHETGVVTPWEWPAR